MDAVRAHLQSVLASDEFRRAPHSSALLRYLVDSAFAKVVPKEYAIATEALGRPSDFDPRADPAVRVEVRRLRQKLTEYDAGPGRGADIELEVPKGAYAIIWSHRLRAGDKPSVVVLPFANLTGDAGKEYFVDGLTEELTCGLACVPELRVVARTSAFLFKDRGVDIREIGARLNVSAIVEGSVRWSEGRVRVTAQLIEADSGFHRWGHSVEADERDLVRCQQELAVLLREALLPSPGSGRIESPEAGPPGPAAYTLFLRARHYWNERTPDGVEKALRLLEEITARFPGYAAPWAARAECCCVLGLDAVTPRELGDSAVECGNRALSLAPHSAAAHAAAGWALGAYRFDHVAAEQHLKRAIELMPGHVMARYVWGMAACALRRFDEGLHYAETAASLDPLSMVARRGVAYACFARGDLTRAREHVVESLDLSPHAPFATYLHGLIEAEDGNAAAGLALLQQAITQAGGAWPLVEGFAAYYLARAGRSGDASAIRARLSSPPAPAHLPLALVELGVGRIDEAIACLERSAAAGEPFVIHIANHPPFPQLLPVPRFQTLCRRLNLLPVRPAPGV